VNAERQLLRLGEYLVGRACRRLPAKIRAERYREWASELPAILHDPQTRFAWRRAARMLGYAADTLRGAARMRTRARRRPAPVISALLVAGLAIVGWDIWTVMQTPARPLVYLRLAWGLLLVACPVSVQAGSAWRVSAVIVISSTLLGAATNLWSAALAPQDWVNYGAAALLIASLLAWWPFRRRARSKKA
jgi:hypothetical protein